MYLRLGYFSEIDNRIGNCFRKETSVPACHGYTWNDMYSIVSKAPINTLCTGTCTEYILAIFSPEKLTDHHPYKILRISEFMILDQMLQFSTQMEKKGFSMVDPEAS